MKNLLNFQHINNFMNLIKRNMLNNKSNFYKPNNWIAQKKV